MLFALMLLHQVHIRNLLTGSNSNVFHIVRYSMCVLL
nr:MAG TPA: hypothetical protein [Caudoviricetes sp.]